MTRNCFLQPTKIPNEIFWIVSIRVYMHFMSRQVKFMQYVLKYKLTFVFFISMFWVFHSLCRSNARASHQRPSEWNVIGAMVPTWWVVTVFMFPSEIFMLFCVHRKVSKLRISDVLVLECWYWWVIFDKRWYLFATSSRSLCFSHSKRAFYNGCLFGIVFSTTMYSTRSRWQLHNNKWTRKRIKHRVIIVLCAAHTKMRNCWASYSCDISLIWLRVKVCFIRLERAWKAIDLKVTLSVFDTIIENEDDIYFELRHALSWKWSMLWGSQMLTDFVTQTALKTTHHTWFRIEVGVRTFYVVR